MDTKDITLKTVAPGANVLYFHTNIENSSVLDFIKDLRTMDAELTEMEENNISKLNKLYSKANLITCDKTPIVIMLSSEGGYCYDGFCLYDTICEISKRRPIEIHVSGLCMSMAVPVLLSVPLENRSAHKNATFMIHQVLTIALGKVADVEQSVDESKRIHNNLWKIISENTKITAAQLNNCYETKKDWYITAEEALELGLISKII